MSPNSILVLDSVSSRAQVQGRYPDPDSDSDPHRALLSPDVHHPIQVRM